MAEKKMTFEEAFAGLEKSAEELRKDSVPLEESIKIFEKGISLYEQCNEILNEAKQKIEVYKK